MSETMRAHHARTVQTMPEQFGTAPSAECPTDTALAVIRRAARVARPLTVPPGTEQR